MDTPYSQASSNFTGSMSSGVDARTGTFTASFMLTQLNANGGSGPYLPVTLQYDPTSSADNGFGLGWGIGWTTFDANNNVLALATGDTYKVSSTSGKPVLKHQKIINSKLTSMSEQYCVQNKTGDVTILSAVTAGATMMPTAIFAANGLSCNLNWGQGNWLRSVVDASGKAMLIMDYDGETSTTIRLWPGTNVEKVIKLVFLNRQLASLQSGQYKWVMNYDNSIKSFNQNAPLISVAYPSGTTETVNYTPDGQGHIFPNCAPQFSVGQTMPYVTTYKKSIAGSTHDRIINYSFSIEHNYLGRNGNINQWSNGEDNTYNVLNIGYTYESTQIIYDGVGSFSTTKNTYNSFHLLISEDVEKNGTHQRTDTDYNVVEGVDFDGQNSIFQLPKKVTVNFIKGSVTRKEITHHDYDEYGNAIRQTTPDGAVTEWEYYPAAGEPSGCPSAPFGMISFVKSRTITPPAVNELGSGPVHKTVYKYSKLNAGGRPGDPKNPVEYAVLSSREEEHGDGVLLSSTDVTYIENPGQVNHGRTLQNKMTYYDSSENPYTTTTDHSYHFDQADSIKIVSKISTMDGISETRSDTYCQYTGSLLESIDDQGNISVCDYDEIGRIVRHTLCSGSEYENAKVFAYDLEKLEMGGSAIVTTTTITDPTGALTKNWYDGEGRVIKSAIEAGGIAQNRLYQTFDALGRLTNVANLDDVPLASKVSTLTVQEASSTNLRVDKQIDYDDWGQQHLKHLSSGAELLNQYDPLTIQSIERYGAEEQQAAYVTAYDACYRPSSVTGAGKFSTKYDGSGRVIQSTDEIGNTTIYEYDPWNRVIKTTLPDKSEVTKTYAPHSDKPLVTSIAIKPSTGENKIILGTQSFDGLNRLTARTNGGRTYRFSYKGSSRRPEVIMGPDGRTVTFDRIPELGGVARSITASDGTRQTFEYDKITGAIIASTEIHPSGSIASGSVNLKMTYNSLGQMVTRTFVDTLNNTHRLMQYEYSMGGLLTSYTDVGGIKTIVGYDEYGRRISTNDGTMSCQLNYDSQGRLSGWVSKTGDHKSTVAVTFDAFNREVSRIIFDSSTTLKIQIDQTFTKNSLLQSRKTTVNESILNEAFDYNNRNQLVHYYCSGVDRPLSIRSDKIKDQEFKYDSLGNIISMVTNTDEWQESTIYLYENPSDPCQLTTIDGRGANQALVKLQYDDNGCMLKDEAERKLQYDVFGRLIRVDTPQNMTTWYQYDAENKLRTQIVGSGLPKDGNRQEFYYLDGNPITQFLSFKSNQIIYRRMFVEGTCVAQRGNETDPYLLGTNQHGTVISASQTSHDSRFSYAAYGSRSGAGDAALPGFNGQVLDQNNNLYFLGNGYRAYSPTLMRFNRPDSLSPFGAGGLNPYAYCEGDPINKTDPTGHYANSTPSHNSNTNGIVIASVLAVAPIGIACSFAAPEMMELGKPGFSAMTTASRVKFGVQFFAVAATVAAAGTSLAAAIEKPKHPKTASALQTISISLGLLAGASLLGVGKFPAKAATELSESEAANLEAGARNAIRPPKNIDDKALARLSHASDEWDAEAEESALKRRPKRYNKREGDITQVKIMARGTGPRGYFHNRTGELDLVEGVMPPIKEVPVAPQAPVHQPVYDIPHVNFAPQYRQQNQQILDADANLMEHF
ncbi:hypothetical protein G3A39_37720 [Paraburkholderia aspalathi]|nr:hypothetical protein [Paraburkholderia aspalathi]